MKDVTDCGLDLSVTLPLELLTTYIMAILLNLGLVERKSLRRQ